jgi:hypothetical protein
MVLDERDAEYVLIRRRFGSDVSGGFPIEGKGVIAALGRVPCGEFKVNCFNDGRSRVAELEGSVPLAVDAEIRN